MAETRGEYEKKYKFHLSHKEIQVRHSHIEGGHV